MTTPTLLRESDRTLLNLNGVRNVLPHGSSVLLCLDATALLAQVLGRIAHAATERTDEIVDRLQEYAWLYLRAEGLANGDLDPVVEEVDQPTAHDLAVVALTELLIACDLSGDTEHVVTLPGLVAPVLASAIYATTPHDVLDAWSRHNVGRNAADA